MKRRHQILTETSATRDRAEALLRSLMVHKNQSEKGLRLVGGSRAAASSPGRSALDNAIGSTQRMIESLNRVLAQTRSELSDEDLELLDERPH